MRFSLLILVLCLTGVRCGYSTSSAMPAGWHNIYVEPFSNSINFSAAANRNLYLPLLEVKAHNAVVDRFLFDGHLRSSPADDADLILKGDLVGYDRGALRYTENQDIQEYRVQIQVNLTLIDAHTKEVIWEEKGFTGEATYFTTGPKVTSEDSAVNDAITDLARRTVERTIENW